VKVKPIVIGLNFKYDLQVYGEKA